MCHHVFDLWRCVAVMRRQSQRCCGSDESAQQSGRRTHGDSLRHWRQRESLSYRIMHVGMSS